jgi:hypothetical protein
MQLGPVALDQLRGSLCTQLVVPAQWKKYMGCSNILKKWALKELCHNVITYKKRSVCSIGQRPVVIWATSAVPSSISLHRHHCADIKRALHAMLGCWCAAEY